MDYITKYGFFNQGEIKGGKVVLYYNNILNDNLGLKLGNAIDKVKLEDHIISNYHEF